VSTVERLETEGRVLTAQALAQRGIISNGVNPLGLFFERMIESVSPPMKAENNPFV